VGVGLKVTEGLREIKVMVIVGIIVVSVFICLTIVAACVLTLTSISEMSISNKLQKAAIMWT
jgi:hypothetical protein